MSIININEVTNEGKVEKISRTKKLENDVTKLREDLEMFAGFVYKRFEMDTVIKGDTSYDSQVYQMFTERIENFEGINFSVEPPNGKPFGQIFVHSDDNEDFEYQRDENIILYSVNGTIVYKQSIDYAMDIISKAKKGMRENEAVILGLLDTWFDDSDEKEEDDEDENEEDGEGNEIKKVQREYLTEYNDGDLFLAFVFISILLITIVVFILSLLYR